MKHKVLLLLVLNINSNGRKSQGMIRNRSFTHLPQALLFSQSAKADAYLEVTSTPQLWLANLCL